MMLKLWEERASAAREKSKAYERTKGISPKMGLALALVLPLLSLLLGAGLAAIRYGLL